MRNTDYILNQPMDQFKKSITSFLNNTVKNMGDHDDMKGESIRLFMTLGRLNKNKQAYSKEMSGLVDVIRKADFNIENLPIKYKNVLNNVFTDFNEKLRDDKDFYSNTFVGEFVGIYNLLHSDKYKKLVSDVNLSKVQLGKEDLNFFNTDESPLDLAQFTRENFFINLFGLGGLVKDVALLSSARVTMVVLMIIVSLFLLTLLTVSIVYMVNRNKHLDNVMKADQQLTPKQSMKKLVENIELESKNSIMKYMVKPASASLLAVTRMLESPGFSVKKLLSKENMNDEALSEESAILVSGIVLFALMSIVPLLRGFLYYISHIKLQIHIFFNEQVELLQVNKEELLEQIENSNDPSEKKRLRTIIDKQMVWSEKFKVIYNTMYKEQIKVGYKVEEMMDQDNFEYYEVKGKLEKTERENQNEDDATSSSGQRLLL